MDGVNTLGVVRRGELSCENKKYMLWKDRIRQSEVKRNKE